MVQEILIATIVTLSMIYMNLDRGMVLLFITHYLMERYGFSDRKVKVICFVDNLDDDR